jgi:DNA polymerase-3 subunit epsilon
MGLDFTAIDFETANRHRGSACSVGVVKVRHSIVVDAQHRLIRPPRCISGFEPRNVAVHGITAAMVADARPWRDTVAPLMRWVGGDVLVAHNALFDMGVLSKACIADGIEVPTVRSVCTVASARALLTLPNYQLPVVTAHLGIQLINHHDALADAHAAAAVLLALAALDGFADTIAYKLLVADSVIPQTV